LQLFDSASVNVKNPQPIGCDSAQKNCAPNNTSAISSRVAKHAPLPMTLPAGSRSGAMARSGIAASCSAFALSMLGRENVAVYDGSLTEWSNDPSLPMEIG
jgi:3-mercaptopyruvate sulfurtransferase SseA